MHLFQDYLSNQPTPYGGSNSLLQSRYPDFFQASEPDTYPIYYSGIPQPGSRHPALFYKGASSSQAGLGRRAR